VASVANTESWNGTTWTEVNDLNTAKMLIQQEAGIQTAALAFLVDFHHRVQQELQHRILEWNKLDNKLIDLNVRQKEVCRWSR
jgi:hypothetical protein